MKVLSIDVGIKNLAICILETNNNGFDVKFWDVINLSEEKTYKCNCNIKNKKNIKVCNKQAQYYKDENFYCKTHANSSNYKLPTSSITKYKSLKLDSLNTLCNEYDIEVIKNNKQSIIQQIEQYIEKNLLNSISNFKCNSINLIDIGKSIRDNLNKIDVFTFTNIDYVLIENQISPIANRMNCIQGMISQYFIMKNIDNILYISAANKLKTFIGTKKTTYNERKKLSVTITKNILLENIMDNINKEKVVEMFNKHKKRDDLADSFLQAIWFLSQDNDKIMNLVNKFKI
jgi:hypothetical protein